ncbi:5'-adenylylsulfate reductase-like 5 [Zingiber officinale]|uniref:5'-adenylylsulfate reductase-like 5 n=1 Tax=Zingiber officinale TaxID=94328 RepID=UPI001C4CFFF0|nr:5'-adenylylsulfate reductase-like 5 [Zingiber officinale]
MARSSRHHLLAFLLLLSPVASFASQRSQPVCPVSDLPFLDHLGSRCPSRIDLSPSVEVSGEMLEKELGSGENSAYYSVLFYASWCPFSRSIRPAFDALNSMFPQIKHLVVEESSIMPSVLSRNGIHSFPSILLINGTTRIRYHGSKSLNSLVYFYKKSIGLDPIILLEIDQVSSAKIRTPVLHFESARELITKEPYLAFSLLFIFLRMIICFVPLLYSRVKAFWASHAWCLNLRCLRESSQLLEQVLHLVDIKRVWSNLKIWNRTRNLQKGANNARVWASSLTSVSLGESSSSSKLSLSNTQ